MKFLSARDFRDQSSEVWKGLESEQEMVVTDNGRPIAILSPVTEETFEETLAAIRRSKAMAAVAEIQRSSVQKRTDSLTADEIDAEIAEVRRARRQRSESL
jgi:antitoxin (DNA-binding transcriptional repressor) of toxin-antitoxin stability system